MYFLEGEIIYSVALHNAHYPAIHYHYIQMGLDRVLTAIRVRTRSAPTIKTLHFYGPALSQRMFVMSKDIAF